MKLKKIIERENIRIEKLLVPSNSGLQNTSPNPFTALGIFQPEQETYLDADTNVEIVQKRAEDIPELCDYYTQLGIPVFGMTGDDLFDEYRLKVPSTQLQLINTEDWIISVAEGQQQAYSRPTLAFIGIKGSVMGEFPQQPRVVVNKKYAYTAAEWLEETENEYGVEFSVRELSGQTESEVPQMADFVIDIVLSGGTLSYIDKSKKVLRDPPLVVLQPIRQSDISIITSWQRGDRYRNDLKSQYSTIEQRLCVPTNSLTSKLLQSPNELIKKLGEENAEMIAAIVNQDKSNFLDELQQSAGWLPMVAAVSLGIKFDAYCDAISNYGGK